MPEDLSVVVLGPSLRVKGGITRVAARVYSNLPEWVRVTHVSTFTQYTGYGEGDRGSRVVQAFVYLSALARLMASSLFSRRAVFHLHLSQRGSFVRKGIMAIWLRTVGARFVVHTHAACDGQMFLKRVPRWANRVMLWGLWGADAVLVLTGYWKRYYATELGFPQDRLVVLPNPANFPAAAPQRSVRGDIVKLLFLGRLGDRKGAFDLIRAFASLPASVRDHCHLTLAGDGEVDQATELANSLGCCEQIRVSAWLGAEGVANVLGESDVFVLPSRGEGMSNALLEAMSWGLAVITTPEGGTDEFLRDGHSALFVNAGSIPEIAGAIERVVGDRELRRSLGRHARRAAVPFDLRHHVDGLVNVWQRLAERTGERRSAREAGAESSPLAGTMG